MSTNKLTNSRFFAIQNSYRSKQEEYNKYIKTIKKEENKTVSFIGWIKKMLGLKNE